MIGLLTWVVLTVLAPGLAAGQVWAGTGSGAPCSNGCTALRS
jgi:hypothetical protein